MNDILYTILFIFSQFAQLEEFSLQISLYSRIYPVQRTLPRFQIHARIPPVRVNMFSRSIFLLQRILSQLTSVTASKESTTTTIPEMTKAFGNVNADMFFTPLPVARSLSRLTSYIGVRPSGVNHGTLDHKRAIRRLANLTTPHTLQANHLRTARAGHFRGSDRTGDGSSMSEDETVCVHRLSFGLENNVQLPAAVTTENSNPVEPTEVILVEVALVVERLQFELMPEDGRSLASLFLTGFMGRLTKNINSVSMSY